MTSTTIGTVARAPGGITIGEVSRRTGLSDSTIRFYQRRGLIPPRPAGGGWQRFGPEAVTRLAAIDVAKRAGFSLDEIAELLAALDTVDSPADALHAAAGSRLQQIDDQIARLQAIRDELTEALRCACTVLDRDRFAPAAGEWAEQHAWRTSQRAGSARRTPGRMVRP